MFYNTEINEIVKFSKERLKAGPNKMSFSKKKDLMFFSSYIVY